jgi:hypothetical protein
VTVVSAQSNDRHKRRRLERGKKWAMKKLKDLAPNAGGEWVQPDGSGGREDRRQGGGTEKNLRLELVTHEVHRE